MNFVIQARLEYDTDFLKLCLLTLYERQETDEQDTQQTQHDNGVGFNKSDSPALSGYAQQLLRGVSLSSTQHTDAARRMKKYSTQLSTLLTAEQIEG